MEFKHAAINESLPVPDTPRMNLEQANTILEATTLETKASVLAMFDLDSDLTAPEINDAMAVLQGNDPVWEPSQPYYAEICRQFAASGLFTVIPGDYRKGTLNRYKCTEAGYYLARSVGGHLLHWGIDSGLPLREAFGEPHKQHSGAIPSLLTRMAILASAVAHPKIDTTLIEQRYDGQLGHSTVSRHCKRLVQAGILEPTSSNVPRLRRFKLKRQYKEPMRELVNIYAGMVTYDPDFYIEGQHLANYITTNPQKISHLIKRVERTSERTGQRRVKYSQLAQAVIAHAQAVNRPVACQELMDMFGADFDTADRRYKFLRFLREHPLIEYVTPSPGDYVFSVKDSADTTSTRDV